MLKYSKGNKVVVKYVEDDLNPNFGTLSICEEILHCEIIELHDLGENLDSYTADCENFGLLNICEDEIIGIQHN